MSIQVSPRKLAIQGILFGVLAAFFPEFFLIGIFSPTESFEIPGRALVVFVSTSILFYYLSPTLPKFSRKDFVTLGLIILGGVILVAISLLVAASLASYVTQQEMLFRTGKEGLYLGIPFAAIAMITHVILGARTALLISLTITLITGIYLPQKSLLVPFVLCSSLVASMTLQRYRNRSAYIKAGFYVSLIAIPFALSTMNLTENFLFTEFALRVVAALGGGFLCSFIVSGFTPVLESLGGYVTDIKLLEMATLEHPLLKDLSVQAPGTWNHSMVIGMMVESAAESIGANPVLARVGAYFHDIGKVKKPLYFVENQSGEDNPHDKLSPSMSALIIRSHVKDGIDLAKKYRLSESLIDMIPQHHGTALIEYFYEKALKDSENGEEVDKNLYQYPGPKPQTREAGILMLADGIEAAARTLQEPTADRLQGLVQKMINKVFSSGQLNECDLTLRDLHLIAKRFTRVLTGIYHHRITYSEPAEKVNESQNVDKKEPKPEEDLKRLGQEEIEEVKK